MERRWEGPVSQSTAWGESRQARRRGQGTFSFQTPYADPGLQHHLSVVSYVVLLYKYSTPFSPAATEEKAGRKGSLCLNDNLPMKGSDVSWAFIWEVGRGQYLFFVLHVMVLNW